MLCTTIKSPPAFRAYTRWLICGMSANDKKAQSWILTSFAAIPGHSLSITTIIAFVSSYHISIMRHRFKYSKSPRPSTVPNTTPAESPYPGRPLSSDTSHCSRSTRRLFRGRRRCLWWVLVRCFFMWFPTGGRHSFWTFHMSIIDTKDTKINDRRHKTC